MVVSDFALMFINVVKCSSEVKDKHVIVNLLQEKIDEISHQKVDQVITDNNKNWKGVGEIIEDIFQHIYWTLCAVYTFNLALKIIFSTKNMEANHETYDEYH